MNQESDEILQEALEEARLVRNTIETPGWTQVIRPALERQSTSLQEQLLCESEYKKVLLTQQSVMAIRNLLGFIDAQIENGKAAHEEILRRQGLAH